MANLKLTDSQCVILAAAGARDSGLVLPLPKSSRVNRGTQTIVLRGLLKKDLIVARAAQPDEEVWETAEDGTRTALIITDAGLDAIGIAPASDSTTETMVAKPRTKGKVPTGSGARDAKNKRAPAANKATDVPQPREGTKLASLIASLAETNGATIDDLITATGWPSGA